jgi:3-hydroxyisobutyrate dehydrogenase
MARVGFVGLGQMGFQMARRLRQAGHELIVSDADEVRRDSFIASYSGSAPSSSHGWSTVDVVILMLPNSNIVEEVLFGDDPLVSHLNAGSLIIDMSSSEPVRTRTVAARLEESGFRMLDAPVSGGVAGAADGKLAVMVGGNEATLEEARPILEVLGSKIFFVGPAGAGHAAKALNNLVSATTLAVTSEALQVGSRFGIDPHLLNSIFNASSGRSNTSENKVERFILSGNFDSGFGLALMAKDVHIAVELAHQIQGNLSIGDPTDVLWSHVASAVPPNTDHTEMYNYVSQTARDPDGSPGAEASIPVRNQ